MLKNLLKGILSAMAIKVLDHYRHLSLRFLKIEAARSYLHGVRLARLSALGLMMMGLLIVFLGVGIVLLHIGLFILLPWTLESKALLAMILGASYMIIAAILLYTGLNEKTWMRKSGASKMLDDALKRSGEE